MAVLDVRDDTLREKTLDAAKRHKASWIALGQYLYQVHKNKLFKNWGYLSFETYCVKELGMKQLTASKLLRSYSFLEQEEPRYVDPQIREEESHTAIPNYESVNLLRLAKDNKKLTPQDYAEIRESVIDKASEPKEVRAQVKKLLSEREVKDPAEERRQRRNSSIRRVVTVMTNARKELENESLLPDYLLVQMKDLIEKLRDQIEE